MSLYLYTKYGILFCGSIEELDDDDKKVARVVETEEDVNICLKTFYNPDSVFLAIKRFIDFLQFKYGKRLIIGRDYNLTDSSGSSIVILMSEKPYVYQLYLHRKTYEKIIRNYERIKEHTHLVKLLDVFPEYNVIKWEKIIPLTKTPFLQKIDIIERELMIGLDQMHKYGVYHGDATLDNAGINSDGVYVWYDFDSSGLRSRADYTQLQRSIKYHSL